MPPALDRLLASPSALRLLRALVQAPEWPATSARCCHCRVQAPRRAYHGGKQASPAGKWPRWKDKTPPKTYKAVEGVQGDGDGANGHQDTDTAQWAQELQRQERLYGLAGIRNNWENNRTLCLPTEDTLDAECLWGTFLRHPDLVLPVLSHAAYLHRKTGAVYPHLYELCMGHWLAHEKHAADALEYHRQILHKFKLRELPLRHLARLGRQRFPLKAYDVLFEIYETSQERNLYDAVIPALLARGSVTAVQQWHALCVRRGDLPSEEVASHPLVRELNTKSKHLTDVEAKLICTVVGAEPAQVAKMDEHLLRRLLGRDMAPVRFDDTTCARMFATRAFTPEAVVKGIAMVGVNEIGPLAVRAMASRADPISDLTQRFEQLKSLGIALQGCVFSVALEKFAVEKQWLAVRSMLESDQHPEVYDDPKLQKELLDFYLQQQDWAQAHRTLAVLSFFYKDANTQSWNILLQAYARSFDPRRIEQTIQLMRDNHVMLTPESILAIKACLRRRQRGHRPDRSQGTGFDDLRFVQRIFTGILKSGMGPIPPTMWREILKRLGMLGRFRELRRLVFWLMCWYAPRKGTEFDALPKPSSLDEATERLCRRFHPHRRGYLREGYFQYFRFPSFRSQDMSADHPIRQLIPPSFQQGLIVWGFRAGLLPNAPLEQSMLPPPLPKRHYRSKLLKARILTRLNWSVGLELLVQLRDHGLHVHRNTVTKAVQIMMTNLFARGPSPRKEVRAMAAANTLLYTEYVREVDRIWGRPLFGAPSHIGRSRMHGLMWHPRGVRRRQVHRKTYLRLDEIAPSWRARADVEGGVATTGSHDTPADETVVQERADMLAARDLEKELVAESKEAVVYQPAYSAMEELECTANALGKRR